MKKRTTTKIPQLFDKFLLCFFYSKETSPLPHSHLLKFSKCLPQKFLWFFQPKRNSSSSRWPQHVVWVSSQSTTHLLAYSSQKKLTWNSHSCWRQQVFTHFWVSFVTHRFIHLKSRTCSVLKMKHGSRSWQDRGILDQTLAGLIGCVILVKSLHALNLGSLIFNR